MKKRSGFYAAGIKSILVLATLSLLTSADLLIAQPQARQHRQGAGEREGAERRREQQANGMRQRGMQWLRDLEQSDPEQYQAVQELREQDPEAFAAWMREYLLERRRQEVLDRHPALKAFLDSLPEDAREELENDLFLMPFSPRVRDRREAAHPATRRPRREMADAASFDARTQFFENELARAEERIRNLRALIERRNAMREQIIGTE